MTVELNEPGKAYFVVVARDADAPTADEVVAGVDYGSVTVVAKCAAFDVRRVDAHGVLRRRFNRGDGVRRVRRG